MLTEILKYVPDQISLGRVCKKFYEISCSIKYFQVQIEMRDRIGYIHPTLVLLDDEKLLNSMTSSKRRINYLSLRNMLHCDINLRRLCIKNFTQIAKRFGKDVKHLKIYFITFPRNYVEILNHFHNLEKIEIIRCETMTRQGEAVLKLFKLKEVEVCLCPESVLRIFDALPVNILRKIITKHIRPDEQRFEDQKLFINQLNIQEVSVDKTDVNYIDLKRLKLKSLVVKRQKSLEGLIEDRNTLTHLAVYDIEHINFVSIKNELKSLENLELCDWQCGFDDEIKVLVNLHKLKKIKFQWKNMVLNETMNSTLGFLNSRSLNELTIECWHLKLTKMTVIELGRKCLHLKKLDLVSDSPINIINDILQNIESLDCLRYVIDNVNQGAPENYTYQDELSHVNLKTLKIEVSRGSQNGFPKLVGSCKNLETFETTLKLKTKVLKEILIKQPDLKSLKLTFNESTEDSVKVFIEFGKNLKFFHCSDFSFNDGITTEMLNESFRKWFEKMKIESDLA